MSNDIKQLSRSVLGMKLEVAKHLCLSKSVAFVVMSIDGMQVDVAETFTQNRINVEVIDGIVTASHVG